MRKMKRRRTLTKGWRGRGDGEGDEWGREMDRRVLSPLITLVNIIVSTEGSNAPTYNRSMVLNS